MNVTFLLEVWHNDHLDMTQGVELCMGRDVQALHAAETSKWKCKYKTFNNQLKTISLNSKKNEWIYVIKFSYVHLILTIVGGGPPCWGGKKAGLTWGAGAGGCPGGGIEIGGCWWGIPVNKINQHVLIIPTKDLSYTYN